MLRLSKDEFEEIVFIGLEEIPEEFKKFFDNLVVVVEERADVSVLKELGLKSSYQLFGLYQGVPIGDRSSFSPFVPPAKISIYMEPILYVSRNVDDVKRIAVKTVVHEIGHHFGMSDEYLHKIGY